MNIRILILLLFSVSLSGQNPIFIPYVSGGYTPPAPGEDLADIHYFFENNSADSSGNAYDATVSAMSYGTTSPPEGSYYGHFVSTSTLFGIPVSYTFTSPFSVSCWVRQENTGDYYEIMDPKATNTWEYWEFWLDGVAYDLEFRGYQNSTNTMDRAGTVDAIWSAGTDWMHIVFTYSNGTVTIYFNGTDVSGTGSSLTTWNTSNMKLNATPMYIGQYFEGDIDDFSVYSFVLTQAQVTTLYNGGTAGTKLTE